MPDIKDATSDSILKLYESRGLNIALQEAAACLRETERGSDLRDEKSAVKGELAETTLLCILREIQKVLNFETMILKGVFVRDDSTGKVTELDVTFITPYAIYLFECKSYSGYNKEARGKCELYRNGQLIADVFSQNYFHLALFNRKYGSVVKYGSKPYRLALYDYATNKFKDTREPKLRAMMPIIDEASVVEWLTDNLSKAKKKGVIVDMSRIAKIAKSDVKRNDKSNQEEHRKQLGY